MNKFSTFFHSILQSNYSTKCFKLISYLKISPKNIIFYLYRPIQLPYKNNSKYFKLIFELKASFKYFKSFSLSPNLLHAKFNYKCYNRGSFLKTSCKILN